MAIMMVVTGAIFQMAGSSQSAFRTQPEAADMQQRLRVASDMIYRDLLMAGAGLERGPAAGSLGQFLPPIRPARRGLQSPDGALTFTPSRISIVYVPQTRSQTSLTLAMPSVSSNLMVDALQAGCPTGLTPCGFSTGMRALVFDTSGVGQGYDLFTVSGTTPVSVQHANPNPAFTKAYPQGSWLTQVEHRVYYLDQTTNQLMLYDGHEADQPLVDNVIALNFTYYADPDPNSAPQPLPGLSNCVYDAGNPPVPKLQNLGGATLVPLTQQQLTDGPTCGVGTNEFDGDLLRVRKVRVTIGVQASHLDLRGSDSQQFAKSGKSSGGTRLVPDYRASFEVTPRNLNLIR